MVTPSTTWPSARTVSRSRSTPSTRITMTSAREAKTSVPVVPCSTDRSTPSTVSDNAGTIRSLGQCRAHARWHHRWYRLCRHPRCGLLVVLALEERGRHVDQAIGLVWHLVLDGLRGVVDLLVGDLAQSVLGGVDDVVDVHASQPRHVDSR